MSDNFLLFAIFMAYCMLLILLAYLIGQLLIIGVEWIADEIERREFNAGKQVKAVSYRSGLERKRTFRIERCERRDH